jgi:hypothetical protein
VSLYDNAVKEHQRSHRVEQARRAPVREGEKWSFVHAGGKRSNYVVESMEAEELGLAALVTLRNLATAEDAERAHVTRKWLHDPPGPSGAYWFPTEDAA